MTLTYENRRGDVYYLHAREDARGTTQYFFAKEEVDDAVDELPEGYEIYENIRGQVFARRISRSAFAELERRRVQRALDDHSPTSRYEEKGSALIIYERSDPTPPDLGDITRGWRAISPENSERYATYTAVLRFELVDEEARTFEASRWWFSEDEWLPLDTGRLSSLLSETIAHIGEPSFFELDLPSFKPDER